MSTTQVTTIELTELPDPAHDGKSISTVFHPPSLQAVHAEPTAGRTIDPPREFGLAPFHGVSRTKRVVVIGLVMCVNFIQVGHVSLFASLSKAIVN